MNISTISIPCIQRVQLQSEGLFVNVFQLSKRVEVFLSVCHFDIDSSFGELFNLVIIKLPIEKTVALV